MASSDVIDTLIAEAGGEGERGLIAAAWAVSQRAAARGQTIDQVIRSGFDGFTNPGREAKKAQQDPKMRARVERILTGVQNGSIPNPVPGADHFLSGDIMPSWAKGMKLVATVGGHRYYASGNVPQKAYGPLVPPGEIPSVATLTDTVRPVPVPATQSPDMRLMRGPMGNAAPRLPLPPMGTPNVADLYAGIYPKGDLRDAGAVGQSVAIAAQASDPALAAALEKRVSSPPVPGRSEFAGQDRAPSRRAPPPLPPSGTAAVSASDRVRGNPDQRGASVTTIASIPTTGVGQPPATRTVQSVPMPPASQQKPATVRVAGFAGPANVPFPNAEPIAPPAPSALSASDRARAAQTKPFSDRLMPTAPIPGPDDLHTAKFTDTTAKVRTGQIDQTGRPVFVPAPLTAPPTPTSGGRTGPCRRPTSTISLTPEIQAQRIPQTA